MRRLVLMLALLALLLVHRAQGAIALVAGQTCSVTGATGSSCVLPNNPGTASFVACGVVTGNAATGTLADANAHSYTASTNSPATNATAGTRSRLFYLANTPANASKTITGTTSGATIDIFCGEFSGVVTTTPLELDAKHTNATSQTNINDPSITTANNGDLLIGVAGPQNVTTSADAPWTGIATIKNGNYSEYYIQPAAGAQAIAFTQNSAGQWSSINGAFKAAASATTPRLTLLGVGFWIWPSIQLPWFHK